MSVIRRIFLSRNKHPIIRKDGIIMNIFTKIKNKLICIYYCGQVSIASVIAQKHICDSDRTKFGYWTNRYIKYLNKYVNELIKMTGVLEKS